MSEEVASPGAPPPRAWPPALDDDLRDILGLMCFQLGAPAHLYRAAGAEIARRAEDEQAFMLHKLLGFWFEHGSEWRRIAGDELRELKAAREAAKAAPQ